MVRTQMKQQHSKMRRVYVFSAPTRTFHWLNVFVLALLIPTGLIIGNPPALLIGTDASANYWFGWVRLIHFSAAYIFIFNWIFRIYWSFMGNKWEGWRNFVPYNWKFIKEIGKVLKYDIFLHRTKEHIGIGHNALAGASYFGLFLLSIAITLTGLALYAPMSTYEFLAVFTVVTDMFGDEMTVRFIHHILMWLFVIFTVIHVYLVLFHDYVEGRGETSSMVGGFKYIEEDCLEEMECEHEE
ncbi:MAG: Ni/Fe-hydrogenase, b-type cytochrome subunit [Bacteroidota bacterium]